MRLSEVDRDACLHVTSATYDPPAVHLPRIYVLLLYLPITIAYIPDTYDAITVVGSTDSHKPSAIFEMIRLIKPGKTQMI